MNDPGLDEPISHNAKDVEEGGPFEEDQDEVDDDQAFLKPSYVSYFQWYLSSTY